MGCFSYICKECGKPVLSNSFRGEKVKLFLLQEGKVIEEMEGEYDSYGRVFDDKGDSIEWKLSWDKVCDLHHNSNRGSGQAAIHSKCYKGKVPITISENDPDQGWGQCDNEYYVDFNAT